MLSPTYLYVALCLGAGALAADLLMVDTLKAEEYVQAIDAGFTVDVVTAANFNSMTTAQFSAYRAIVIGDPYCSGISNIEFLNTNTDVWSSAVMGNIVLIGTDPSYHASVGTAGARSLMTSAITFAAGDANETGLYMAMSCYGYQTPVSALSYFGVFNMNGYNSDDTHIVASSPALGSLADKDIRDWGLSTHEVFTAYPTEGANPFLPLAIVNGVTGPGSMEFGDRSSGTPYILARGATPAGCGDEIWQEANGEDCDNGTSLNGQDGNECSAACRCVSGLPDGAGHCIALSSNSTSSVSSSTEASSTQASSTEASGTFAILEASSTEASSTEASSTEASSTEAASSTETTSTEQASSTEVSSTNAFSTETSITESTTSILSTASSPSTGSDAPSESSTTNTVPSDSSSETLYPTSSSVSVAPPFYNRTSSTASSSDSIGSLDTSTTSISDSVTPIASSATDPLATPTSLPTNIPTSANTDSSTTPSLTSATTVPVSTLASDSSTGTLPQTTAPLPSTPPTFIIQVVFTTPNKRQLAANFLVLNSAGNVEIIPACLQASLFSISAQGRLSSNALVARALPARIATGSEPFTFALPVAGQVDTTFLTGGGQLSWNNLAFGNGNAIFAMNPTSRLIEVFYSGTPPLNYLIATFRIIPGSNVANACLALGGGSIPGSGIPTISTGTSPIPTPPPNDKPVGLEKVVYVTVRTVIVGRETVCLTDPVYTSTKFIHRSAVPGSPCYACLLASENVKPPNNDHRKYTVITSSCTAPNSALFTAPSAVYIPCPTCTATTLRGAAVTPGAAPIANPSGFSPVKTLTIGGGEVIFGSVTVSGKVVGTALAVQGNAPQAAADQAAQAAKANKPVEVAPTAAAGPNVNNKPAEAGPTGAAPVNVNTKAAEANPPQGTFFSANTKPAEAPTDAPQPTKAVVSGSAVSLVNGLAFLPLIILGLII